MHRTYRVVMPWEALERMEFWGSGGTAFALGPPFAASCSETSVCCLRPRIYPTHSFSGNLAKYTVVWGSDDAHDVQ